MVMDFCVKIDISFVIVRVIMKRKFRGSILIPSKVIWRNFQSCVTSLKWLCTISVPICPSIISSMSSGRLLVSHSNWIFFKF